MIFCYFDESVRSLRQKEQESVNEGLVKEIHPERMAPDKGKKAAVRAIKHGGETPRGKRDTEKRADEEKEKPGDERVIVT